MHRQITHGSAALVGVRGPWCWLGGRPAARAPAGFTAFPKRKVGTDAQRTQLAIAITAAPTQSWRPGKKPHYFPGMAT
jgi:hypothetical protein